MPNKKKKGFRRCRPGVQPTTKHPNRSGKPKLWSDDQMAAALEAVMKDGLSSNRAADTYGVPRSTLKDRISGRVVHGVNPGPKPYLTEDEERDLADHLLKAAEIGYGKTRRDVCCIVETYLKQKGTLKGEAVSHGWWEKFMRRNPSLRLRVGDSTAGVRLDAVNEENMKNYFDLLKKTYTDHGFDKHPQTIYNMGSTLSSSTENYSEKGTEKSSLSHFRTKITNYSHWLRKCYRTSYPSLHHFFR